MKTNILFITISLFTLLGLIAVTSCDRNEYKTDQSVLDIIDDFTSESLKNNVIWLQDMQPRFMFSDNRKQIAMDIKQKFISYGYTNVEIDSFFITEVYEGTTYNQWQYNVIATITGTESPDSVCILGAHYDCIVEEGDPFENAPGANDNASGVSVVLETAKILKSNNFVPKTTIQFVAFAAEEMDLGGSYEMVQDIDSMNKKVKMMINADMVAYEPSTDSKEWVLNIMDYYNSDGLRDFAVEMAYTYTLLETAHNNTYNDAGDSYSFSQNGYKAIFLIGNSDDTYYHTVNDVYTNYNFDYCREVAKLACAMLIVGNK